MFLVKDRRLGMDNYVFTQTDPRTEGYKSDVIEGVTLDYDMNAIHLWPDRQPRPNPQLGRDPKNPKHYKVFKFREELDDAESSSPTSTRHSLFIPGPSIASVTILSSRSMRSR
jgi:hypothetical protein